MCSSELSLSVFLRTVQERISAKKDSRIALRRKKQRANPRNIEPSGLG